MKNFNKKKIRVCRVATIPFALLSYTDHLLELQNLGCELTVVTSNDNNFHLFNKTKIHRAISINIEREINIKEDIKSLFSLYKLFKAEKFDLIHSNTPKAGLLVAIAGFFTQSKVIHTFTGQRWQTLSGIKRSILIFCDKIITILNNKTFCDSPSQREFLLENGIGSNENLFCIGHGSFAGVNLERFNQSRFKESKSEILKDINTAEHYFVISYIGRVVRDKGINELLIAFNNITNLELNIKLLIIGPIDNVENELDPLPQQILSNNKHIIRTGYTTSPERYLAISHLFCIPSYREGFGTVVIEAAAMGVPSIGTNIVGLKDAIIDNKTGLLVDPFNTEQLESAITKLYNDQILLNNLSSNSFNYILNNFSHLKVSKDLYLEYIKLLS